VRCPGPRSGRSSQKEHDAGANHDLYRRPRRHQADGIRRTWPRQNALQARKHIAALQKARPGISIEIRWCPAHKGVAGNEKADEWAKVAAEEPDARGVEWLNYDYGGRSEVRAIPLPRSLTTLKRGISEKKWAEACQWAGGRTSKAKYRMPKSQKPDGVVAGSTKRLASRFYQIKTGHCLTGQYLNWTKSRATPQCWCRYPHQTREPLQGVP